MNADPATYPPLETLKPVVEDVWIVDGPTIPFGPPLLKIRHPTRMTVLRLENGSLFLHSPTRRTDGLQRDIDAIGTVRWIVGPNRVHYWWIPDWHAAYPEAEVWLAPRIRRQAGTRIDFAARDLAGATSYPWDSQVGMLATSRSHYMTEYEFFHRPSRTLVLTDLVENFELHKVDSVFTRLVIRLAGANGSTPRDLRLFGSRDRLKRAVETMIAWRPERIILAHGRWFESNAVAELRRIFDWLL